jgi:hypothetical protein
VRAIRLILAAAIAVFWVPTLAADVQSSGTIVIDQTQVELILGGDLGKGHLSAGGTNYTFKTGGLKVGGIGVHTEHLIGHAYHMTDAADFAGTYFEAEAGIAIVKGKGGMWMENAKGVAIHLRSADDSGVALSVGVEGFNVHDLEAQ